MPDICDRLSDEIDLCVNEGAGDIAGLLEDARWEILKLRNLLGRARQTLTVNRPDYAPSDYDETINYIGAAICEVQERGSDESR